MKLNPETCGKLRARDVKIIEYVNSSTTKGLEKMIYDMMLMKILPTTLDFGVIKEVDIFIVLSTVSVLIFVFLFLGLDN